MNTAQTQSFNTATFLATLSKKRPSSKAFIQFLTSLYANGGPKKEEFSSFEKVLNHYLKHLSKAQLLKLSKKVQSVFDNTFVNSLTGHAALKPHGYAGDYEVIDMIYLNYLSVHQELTNWDHYFNWVAASKAVRNRKQYFKNVLNEYKGQPLQVLNIASGPCRDVLEYFEEENPADLSFDCVEADINAILHATKLNRQHLPKITFYNKNIFKFTTDKQYDLIWSAGLFDYFDDTTFTDLIARIHHFVKPGGQLIIGNFNVVNSSRGFMEIMLGWFLHHRSEVQMEALAKTACGNKLKSVTIESEPEGVNLFMRLQF